MNHTDINLTISKKDFNIILDNIKSNSETYLCFKIMYNCGLRVGELLALTIDDINISKQEIKINKSLSIINNIETITSPKYTSASRIAHIPTLLCTEINDYLKNKNIVSPGERLFKIKQYRLKNDLTVICLINKLPKYKLSSITKAYKNYEKRKEDHQFLHDFKN